VRLLIVAAVAALTGIVTSYMLKKIDGPWDEDSAIRAGTVGAVSALVALAASRNLRRKD